MASDWPIRVHAMAVADDREAEDIVNRLQVRGYALASLVEQDYVNAWRRRG